MTQNKKTYRGFTLIELMVVMAIIAVLSTLIIGAIQLARNTATETTNRSNARTVETALESNFAKYRTYCGGDATNLNCNTAGDTTSIYNLAYAADKLGVQLTLASACVPYDSTGHTPSLGNSGGGTVHVEAGKYWIIPFDSVCAVAQDGVNQIKAGY